MSTERPLEEESDESHNAEKQTMDAPQEEFVADQSIPSRDISAVRDVQEGDELEAARQNHDQSGSRRH